MKIDPGARVEQVGSVSHDREDWQRFDGVRQRCASLGDGKTGIASCSCIIARLAHGIDHSIIRSVGPSRGIICPGRWIARWCAPRLDSYVVCEKVAVGIDILWVKSRLLSERT